MKSPVIITLVSALFLTNLQAEDGAALFKQNCGACHSIGKGKLVGPDLKGTHSKYEKPWLTKWIRSSQELVKAKDPIAVKLFEENGQIPMPDQALSDSQIEAVINFIESETTAQDAPPAAAAPEVTTTATNVKKAGANVEGSSSSSTLTYAFGIISLIMLGVIVVLGNVIKKLSRSITNSTNDDKRLM